MLWSMDACYSGSIGEACEGIPGVLFITAANAVETSKADMRDPDMGIWLSNGFTRGFQETVDSNPDIILRDLYYELARSTVGSHATVYNVEYYGNMYKESMNEYF
jgi:glycosylphosphatidylinositol transamidase (GPIT) subunit GPI8